MINRLDNIKRLEGVLDKYKHKNKELILLVNQFVRPQDSLNLERKIKSSLLFIFDHHIKCDEICQDKLSIMSYGKNTTRCFDLISIEKNKT